MFTMMSFSNKMQQITPCMCETAVGSHQVISFPISYITNSLMKRNFTYEFGVKRYLSAVQGLPRKLDGHSQIYTQARHPQDVNFSDKVN
jgi:hypothetical protein